MDTENAEVLNNLIQHTLDDNIEWNDGIGGYPRFPRQQNVLINSPGNWNAISEEGWRWLEMIDQSNIRIPANVPDETLIYFFATMAQMTDQPSGIMIDYINSTLISISRIVEQYTQLIASTNRLMVWANNAAQTARDRTRRDGGCYQGKEEFLSAMRLNSSFEVEYEVEWVLRGSVTVTAESEGAARDEFYNDADEFLSSSMDSSNVEIYTIEEA